MTSLPKWIFGQNAPFRADFGFGFVFGLVCSGHRCHIQHKNQQEKAARYGSTKMLPIYHRSFNFGPKNNHFCPKMAKLAKYLISEMFVFVFYKPTYCVKLLKQAVFCKRMSHWDAFASHRFYIQDVIDIFDNNGIADSMKTRFLQLSWLMISAAMNRTRTKMINVLSQGATNTLNKHGKIRIYVCLPTLYERRWVLTPPPKFQKQYPLDIIQAYVKWH